MAASPTKRNKSAAIEANRSDSSPEAAGPLTAGAGGLPTVVPPLTDVERLTPAMRQYQEQKQQVGDAILLFRMGDFYELFYDDAVRGSKLLGIALTSRDSGRTPLAGIPYHALESYLAKLVAAGLKVAISEQIEDAKQAKGVIKRALTRIVTPGTLTEEALLERSTQNVLAAACLADGQAGIAALELSTGHFELQLCPAGRVGAELIRIAPAEVLLAESDGAGRSALEEEVRERGGATVTYRPATDFASARAVQLLCEQFETRSLAGFGFEHADLSLQAAGALLAYVRETQRLAARHLQPPRRRMLEDHLALDPVTLRALEIERTIRTGTRDGSLLAAVDRTCNPMGARLLRSWLCYPLREAPAIRRRQALIGSLRNEPAARAALRRALREMGDLSRLIGRLGVQRASPRDLRALGNGLRELRAVRAALSAFHDPDCEAYLTALDGLDPIAERLCTALRDDAPLTVREGGIFAAGEHAELDRLRLIGSDGEAWLAEFQVREARRSGINSLRVAFNRVYGYYIEITHVHRDRIPADYVRKQTVKNAERYITEELKQYETEVLTAATRANELEHELFLALRVEVAREIPGLQRAAAALAEIDVLAGLAEWSLERRGCRPELVDEPVLEITAGRHPVVEQALDARFVPNDSQLGADGRFVALITGPNMAGKSTYIRQVALLTLLAHVGAWVPAEGMRLGPVDRIFTRVGASDELARGQSTFMVEMLETANILHNATPQSLVILDEVGRGTSTYDGLALAWAITEHLATRVGCRTLFATHYHELTELADLLDTVVNLNVAVREFEDQVVFLHRIVPGAADRSYGVHVAKLAGVPRAVLERAGSVLNELEKAFSRESHRSVLAAVQRRRQRQLRLFEAAEETIVRQLRELNLDALGEDAARRQLAAWRILLDGEGPPIAGEVK